MIKAYVEKLFRKLRKYRFAAILSPLSKGVMELQCRFFRLKWKLQKAPMPTPEDIALIRENVTFIYKSFQRQRLARELYHNIQQYYPGVQVIVADDSAKPLQIKGDHIQIIQLPFNSGISYGINCALKQVKTPYVIRMDDDRLITPFTNFHGQLRFLMEHPEVDLAAVSYISLPRCPSLEEAAAPYYEQRMEDAPLPLKIPHMTWIDENHIVLAKPPNVFVIQTETLRRVGYDNNIRMIDHNEFFYRASGVLVSVLDPKAYTLHRHDMFDAGYKKYRDDIKGDIAYIHKKQTGTTVK